LEVETTGGTETTAITEEDTGSGPHKSSDVAAAATVVDSGAETVAGRGAGDVAGTLTTGTEVVCTARTFDVVAAARENPPTSSPSPSPSPSPRPPLPATIEIPLPKLKALVGIPLKPPAPPVGREAMERAVVARPEDTADGLIPA
jgi:hypothetical protein